MFIYIIINTLINTLTNHFNYIFLSHLSNITLRINGIGYNKIFGSKDHFYSQYYPNEVYINGKKQDKVNYTYYFNDTDNYVQLKWNLTITNCNYMFEGCHNITEIDLSNFDSSQVSSMSYMFENCRSLKLLELSNLNTSKVTNMDHLFENCYSLTELDLFNFDTSKVIDMNSMFYNCLSFTSINLSKFNTSQVKSMNHMFYNCLLLTSLNLSNFNTSKVTRIYSIFMNCINLEYINLSKFNCSGATVIDHMFENIPNNAVICIQDNDNNKNIIDQIKNKACYTIDCSIDMKKNRKRLISKNNTCIDNCININFYEYKYKCHENCPNETIENNKTFFCDKICAKKTPFLYKYDYICKENCDINDIKDNLFSLENNYNKILIKNETINIVEGKVNFTISNINMINNNNSEYNYFLNNSSSIIYYSLIIELRLNENIIPTKFYDLYETSNSKLIRSNLEVDEKCFSQMVKIICHDYSIESLINNSCITCKEGYSFSPNINNDFINCYKDEKNFKISNTLITYETRGENPYSYESDSYIMNLTQIKDFDCNIKDMFYNYALLKKMEKKKQI